MTGTVRSLFVAIAKSHCRKILERMKSVFGKHKAPECKPWMAEFRLKIKQLFGSLILKPNTSHKMSWTFYQAFR